MKKCRSLLLLLALVLGISCLQTTQAQAAVKLNRKSLTLTEGQSATLKLTGTKKKVTWKSSKKSVATVTQKGKVRAKSAGSAVITAKYGKKSKKCTVTVRTDYSRYYEYQIKYGKITINKVLNISDAALVIPETIDGCPVVELADGLFQNCDGLESITLPSGVTRIGADLFSGCQKLREIKSDAAFTAIGARAFCECRSLEKLPTLSDITAIPDGAFYNCDALTMFPSITTLTSIGAEAFYDCDALLTFYGADTLVSIGDRAFQGCETLLGITGCKNVTTIGAACFAECTQMTSAALGSKLTTLGADAFSGCTRLSGVTLPGTLTAIPDRCFYNCHALETLGLPLGTTKIGAMAFFNCIGLRTITIPGTSLSSIAPDAFAGVPLNLVGVWYHATTTGSYLESWLAASGIPAANQHAI